MKILSLESICFIVIVIHELFTLSSASLSSKVTNDTNGTSSSSNNINVNHIYDPKIHHEHYVAKIEYFRKLAYERRRLMQEDYTSTSDDDDDDEHDEEVWDDDNATPEEDESSSTTKRHNFIRRVKSVNNTIIKNKSNNLTTVSGDGVTSRNLTKVTKRMRRKKEKQNKGNGTSNGECKPGKHALHLEKDWYREKFDTNGYWIISRDKLKLKFKIQNTKCNVLKAQNAWAYIHMDVTCATTIYDIHVRGLVNQQNEVTDYLNIFIDGQWIHQYSAYPQWEDDLKEDIKPKRCSMGLPKLQLPYQPITLQPGHHYFAIQVATNAAPAFHDKAFYTVKFVLEHTNTTQEDI